MASSLRGLAPAFEELYQRYAHRVLRYSYRLLRDEQEAESITQEVFLRLINNSTAYDPSRRFSTWIYAIARNLCLDALARCRPEAIGDGDQFTGNDPDPATAARDRERRQELRAAIDALPLFCREVVHLRISERLESLRALAEGLSELREAEDVLAPSRELWRQLRERAAPLLQESRRRHSRALTKRSAPSRRPVLRRSWAVATSVLLLVGVAGTVLFLSSDMPPAAVAAIVETVGPVKIKRPGQPRQDCRGKSELRVGDVLSTHKADGAVRLDDATRLALRRGCQLEAKTGVPRQQAGFVLRKGTLFVDTTEGKQRCSVKIPGGTVHCRKGKTLIRVASPRESTVTALEGHVEVESFGRVGVVFPGVCAEVKRSKPCCYRTVRPRETRCDWVDRCGKPEDGKKE